MRQPVARRGPGRPPATKSADTRDRIVAVAREVFCEVGYDAATYQAIASRAGVTRPAINHHFASKRMLYREVLKQTHGLVVTPAIDRAQQAAGLVERLSSFTESVVQANAENPLAGVFLVTSVMETRRHPELRLAESDSLRKSREFLAWAVTDAVEHGELGADTDTAPLVETLTALLWGIGFYGSFIGSDQQLDAVSARLPLLLAGKFWRPNV